jgi:anti-anti-sigma factor
MECTISHEQGRVPVTVFKLKGDLDVETYEQLQTQAQQTIQSGTRYMLLDMAQVPYVSSYGIRALSQIFTWLRDSANGDDDASISHGVRDGTYKSHGLKLFSPTAQVLKVLSATGLDMFLEIHTNRETAINSF